MKKISKKQEKENAIQEMLNETKRRMAYLISKNRSSNAEEDWKLAEEIMANQEYIYSYEDIKI